MTTRPEQRLLAVFAHPDDETIGAGALLALAVAAGVDVSVVTCTRGERGEVIPPELSHLGQDPEALAERRERELSGALAELGVQRLLLLDQVPALTEQRSARFQDSGMRWVRPGVAGPGHDAGAEAFTAVDVEVAAQLLAVVIRHVRPTTVLTEEPGGGYGHPDHVHAHRVTMRAVEIAGGAQPAPSHGPDPLAGLSPWQVPSVLWVAQEEAHLRAALSELEATVSRHEPRHGANGAVLTVPDPGAELPGVAAAAHELTASFDVRPVADRVLAALGQHRTQVQAVAPIDGARLVGQLALSNAALMPVLDRVYLRPAPGSEASGLASALAAAEADGAGPGPVAPPAASAPPASLTPAGAVPPPTTSHPDLAGPTGPVEAGAPHLAPHQPGAAPTGTRPAQRGPLARLVTSGGTAGVLMSLLAGIVMGVLGTVVHRYELQGWPLGVALGLFGVLAAAVAARAAAGGGGLLLAALAVVVVTQAMAFLRPGGDILVTNELISYVWLFGAPLAAIGAALLPARWFSDGRGRRP